MGDGEFARALVKVAATGGSGGVGASDATFSDFSQTLRICAGVLERYYSGERDECGNRVEQHPGAAIETLVYGYLRGAGRISEGFDGVFGSRRACRGITCENSGSRGFDCGGSADTVGVRDRNQVESDGRSDSSGLDDNCDNDEVPKVASEVYVSDGETLVSAAAGSDVRKGNDVSVDGGAGSSSGPSAAVGGDAGDGLKSDAGVDAKERKRQANREARRKNQARKQRKHARQRAESVVQEVDSRTSLRKSLEEKWELENKLAAEKARRQLKVLNENDVQDEVKRYRTMVMRQSEANKVAVERSFAKLAATGNVPGVVPVPEPFHGSAETVLTPDLSDGTSPSCTISPDSSASMHEFRKVQKKALDLEAENVKYRSLLKKAGYKDEDLNEFDKSTYTDDTSGNDLMERHYPEGTCVTYVMRDGVRKKKAGFGDEYDEEDCDSEAEFRNVMNYVEAIKSNPKAAAVVMRRPGESVTDHVVRANVVLKAEGRELISLEN